MKSGTWDIRRNPDDSLGSNGSDHIKQKRARGLSVCCAGEAWKAFKQRKNYHTKTPDAVFGIKKMKVKGKRTLDVYLRGWEFQGGLRTQEGGG